MQGSTSAHIAARKSWTSEQEGGPSSMPASLHANHASGELQQQPEDATVAAGLSGHALRAHHQARLHSLG